MKAPRVARPPPTVPASVLVAPEIITFVEYWKSRCPVSGVAPARADLAVETDLPALSRHLYLLEPAGEGFDFRIVAPGADVAAAVGTDPTGRLVSDLTTGAYLAAIRDLFRETLALNEPIYSITNYLHPSRDHLIVERITAPLRSAGTATDMLAVMQIFHFRDEATRGRFGSLIDEIARDDLHFSARRYRVL